MKKLFIGLTFLLSLTACTLAVAGRWFFIPTPASSFDPTQLTGLQFDLDATVSSSITKDGSNNVAQWTDLSKNGYAFTNGTTKPVYTATGGPNSAPAMTFTTSSSSFVNTTKFLSGSSQAFTLWMVLKQGGNTITLGDTTNHDNQMFFHNAGYANLAFGSANSGPYPCVRASSSFNTGASSWYAVSLSYSGGSNVANYQFYDSNVSTTTTTSSDNSGTYLNGTIIGNQNGGGSPSSGIALVVLTNVVTSSTERAQMQTYINSKFGL